MMSARLFVTVIAGVVSLASPAVAGSLSSCTQETLEGTWRLMIMGQSSAYCDLVLNANGKIKKDDCYSAKNIPVDLTFAGRLKLKEDCRIVGNATVSQGDNDAEWEFLTHLREDRSLQSGVVFAGSNLGAITLHRIK